VRPWYGVHGFVIGLIVLGVVSRLFPHPWNATPVMAIALFGGTYLSKRWAILLPLMIVAVSDVLIGWHDTIPFTWGAFVLTGMLAWWIRRSPSAFRIMASALSGSVLFFLITNFGVWVAGSLYPRTAAGLWHCYVAAIPFFRNTVIGDLIYTTVFFGGYALTTSLTVARQTSRSG
jgi:hypothetical protein